MRPPKQPSPPWDGLYHGSDDKSEKRLVKASFDYEPGELLLVRRPDHSVVTERIKAKLGRLPVKVYGLTWFLYSVEHPRTMMKSKRLIEFEARFDFHQWIEDIRSRRVFDSRWLSSQFEYMDDLIRGYPNVEDGEDDAEGRILACGWANRMVDFMREEGDYSPPDAATDRDNRRGLYQFCVDHGFAWDGDSFFLPKDPPI